MVSAGTDSGKPPFTAATLAMFMALGGVPTLLPKTRSIFLGSIPQFLIRWSISLTINAPRSSGGVFLRKVPSLQKGLLNPSTIAVLVIFLLIFNVLWPDNSSFDKFCQNMYLLIKNQFFYRSV